MLATLSQNTWHQGEFSPYMSSRYDADIYSKGAETIENWFILPHGGLYYRPGTEYIQEFSTTGLVPSECRSTLFDFARQQQYVLTFVNLKLYITKNKTLVATITTPYTGAELAELRMAQSNDTMIIVHYNHAPYKLLRAGSDTAWTFTTFTMSNIPNWNYGAGAEPIISATRGYPRSVVWHQDRLIFGGLKSLPQTLMASVVSDYGNFDTSTTNDDKAFIATLSSKDVQQIRDMASQINLIIATASGEWEISGGGTDAPLTPTNAEAHQHTEYGISVVPIITVDSELYFNSSDGKSIRNFIYNNVQDRYLSDNKTTIAAHLFDKNTLPTSVAYLRSFRDTQSNLLFVVREDGQMAVLVVDTTQKVLGWSRIKTNGYIRSVVVCECLQHSTDTKPVDSLYLLIERNNKLYQEVMTADRIVLDSFTKLTSGSPTTSWSGVSHLNGYTAKVVADGLVVHDVEITDGTFTTQLPASTVYVGLAYQPIMKSVDATLVFNSQVQKGKTYRKISLAIDFLNSYSCTIDNKFQIPFRKLGDHLLDQPLSPFTGTKIINITGSSKNPSITITVDEPLDCTITNITLKMKVS